MEPPEKERVNSRRARLLALTAATTLASSGSSVFASAAGTRPETPSGPAGERVDARLASTRLATTAPTSSPATTVPATTPPTTNPTTTAPPATAALTTTEPSPAIVPVTAPAAPYASVWTSDGGETARIQERLIELGFWHSGVDGSYGPTTSQAVMAFQKYIGLEASGTVDQATADALTNMQFRAHGLADAGTLVEIDQTMQLLFIVQNGRTVWVLNASSGNGETYSEQNQNFPDELVNGVAITRNGLHAVYREHSDGWRAGDLGEIHRPKYFSGGQAIHGSNNVPNYPATHGCVRVSVPAMEYIWEHDLMPMDIPVWVHGED